MTNGVISRLLFGGPHMTDPAISDDDITQDIRLKIASGQLRRYSNSAFRNRAIDLARRSRRFDHVLRQYSQPLRRVDPLEIAIQSDLVCKIEKIAAKTRHGRDVVRLILEGRSQSEVAREVGLSRQRVHQILDEIRTVACQPTDITKVIRNRIPSKVPEQTDTMSSVALARLLPSEGYESARMDAGAARGAGGIVGRPRVAVVRVANPAGCPARQTPGQADRVASFGEAVREAMARGVGTIR